MSTNIDLSMDSEGNKESWSQVLHEIDGAQDHVAFNRLKSAISPILRRAMEAQFDSFFKADVYFNHVRFFPPSNRESKGGPRVTLELRSSADSYLYVSICDWDIQYQSPAQYHRVKPEEGFAVFTRYLQHLWEETMPAPIPEPLRRKENYE